MADYQCHPLWDLSPRSYEDIDPDTLPISEGLKKKISDWAAVFDETLDIADPANSGLKSGEVEADFKAQGIKIAEQLQKELGPGFMVSVKV
ncbi:hypothetical protein [Ralstonia solanacearum]|uniref:hypothetical protein n=1 Tax=Ralstonia solanacearum TaxID=305 RepID=UPI0019CFADE0|nr:hypothetical protein [Ralstonia solanacearum]MCL9845574.1 hypothetical protein [Ralstonia solanacearum]MDC6255307.1 hypothetical protein [Ralstonia solanacearum]MDC6259484.1 hypothetical protein [Ralstonia solanacearum]MDC6303827.1 hypothetical protein [Ralstonia solanacearum]